MSRGAAMNLDEKLYYRRRVFEEEVAIRRATCLAARERHEELASAYRLRLRYADAPHHFVANTLGFTAGPASDEIMRSPGTSDTPAPELVMPVVTLNR